MTVIYSVIRDSRVIDQKGKQACILVLFAISSPVSASSSTFNLVMYSTRYYGVLVASTVWSTHTSIESATLVTNKQSSPRRAILISDISYLFQERNFSSKLLLSIMCSRVDCRNCGKASWAGVSLLYCLVVGDSRNKLVE